MLDQLHHPLLMLAGLSAALVAGVFLTFSDFVMRALGASAPSAGGANYPPDIDLDKAQERN